MTASAAVFAILVALLLGAMIPGPSFVLVARNAIGLSRRDGLATALGVHGLACGLWHALRTGTPLQSSPHAESQ